MSVQRRPDRHHCVTCGDDGDPMTVLLVEPVVPGEQLLVHAGTAIARLEAGGRAVAG
jgi:hypothetical protein